MWSLWREFWDVWVPEVTKGEPYDLVHNGDVIDGVHHGSTTQISHNIEDQLRIAEAVLGPQIAKEQAGATGSQTTILFAMLGVGQLLTSTLIMRYNHKMINKGMWFMCGLCWGGSVQILLGQSSSLLGMGFFLFAWGMGGGFYMNLSQTLIQNNTPPEVMGRVMAFHSLLISGLAPMAALLVGVIARKLDNAPLTFSCAGALMLSLALYFTATKKHLRPMA
jgi:MFS family permease